MQDEMPDEQTASSVYSEERLPSYTMWTSFALGARPPRLFQRIVRAWDVLDGAQAV